MITITPIIFTSLGVSLYRSQRPSLDDDINLSHLSIQTILSLEGEREDDLEAMEFPDIKVISEPIDPIQIYFTGISLKRLDEILSVIAQAPKPVLVHCQHGQDRTGLIVAACRVRMQGWSKEKAMAEALQFGYRSWLNFGLNKTWRKFS